MATPGRSFRVGTPRVVRRDLPRASLEWTYGMSPARDAILVQQARDEGQIDNEIRVVVDWFTDLERLLAERERGLPPSPGGG